MGVNQGQLLCLALYAALQCDSCCVLVQQNKSAPSSAAAFEVDVEIVKRARKSHARAAGKSSAPNTKRDSAPISADTTDEARFTATRSHAKDAGSRSKFLTEGFGFALGRVQKQRLSFNASTAALSSRKSDISQVPTLVRRNTAHARAHLKPGDSRRGAPQGR